MTLALQLFKNSIDTHEKLRLNLHSLSVSELLEYGRYEIKEYFIDHNVVILFTLPFRQRSRIFILLSFPDLFWGLATPLLLLEGYNSPLSHRA
jgi:hypothetical protein